MAEEEPNRLWQDLFPMKGITIPPAIDPKAPPLPGPAWGLAGDRLECRPQVVCET